MESRPANLIDIFRLWASFAIIWHHSNYILTLGDIQSAVHAVRYILFYWAITFFYTTTAYLAFKSNLSDKPVRQKLKRITKILLLLLTFTFFHEFPRLVMLYQGRLPVYSPFRLLDHGSSFSSIIFSLVNTILTANNSAAYFLSHVLIIFLISWLISAAYQKFHNKALFLAGFCAVTLVIFLGFQENLLEKIGHIILMDKHAYQRGIMAIIIGGFFAVLEPKIKPKQKLSLPLCLLLLISPILTVSLPSFYTLSSSLLTYINTVISSIIFGGLIIYIGEQYNNINNVFLTKISEWGQRYSLGIFLFHPFILMTLDHVVPYTCGIINLGNAKLIIFIIINILGFYLSLLFARLCRTYFPWLISLS